MSLGLLAQYSSESDLESGEESEKKCTEAPLISPEVTSEECEELHKGKSFFEDDFESSTSDGSDVCYKTINSPVGDDEIQLPLPELENIHTGKPEVLPGSVFSNPFKEAEDAKLSVLKKHVDLAPSEEKLQPKDKRTKFVHRNQRINSRSRAEQWDEHDSSFKAEKRKHKKSGVSGGLVPPKKYMRLHQEQQAKERPWTLK